MESGFQNARRQLMLLQQVPEIHDCRILGDRSAERQPGKVAHRRDLVKRFFNGWVAQRKPVLQQVSTQHGFQWVRLAATASLWVVRLDQRHQPASRNHLFHLGQETLATGLRALNGALEIGKAHLIHGEAGL